MRIPLGKQGENNAVLVVWPEIAEKYAKLYGKGRFELVVVQRGKAYPAVVNVDGADLVWDVRAADVATAEVGSLELIYYVGDTIAKSQTWETLVVASKSADGMTEPPEDPARAWFDEIKRQIGDLNKLTTKDKENLVAAINEAARTGLGGGSVEMRVDGGYIQYSTDGVTWENLIAVADLEGKPGKDGEPGAPGKDGEPGKDGHTPKIAATKTGKITSINADGVEIAQIKDGEDAAADLSLGLTAATIGQTIKVKAVDTDGKPTAWEAVDMAEGETWELIRDFTLAEDVVKATINLDENGKPFRLKKAYVFITATAPTDESITYSADICCVTAAPPANPWGQEMVFLGESPAFGKPTRFSASLWDTYGGCFLPVEIKSSFGDTVANALVTKISYDSAGAIKVSGNGLGYLQSPCESFTFGSYRKSLFTGANIKIYGVRA
nr:MAG TPA: nucleoid-associated protein [Caudoviricetes sp.]